MGDIGQTIWMVVAFLAALWMVSTLLKARGRGMTPTSTRPDPAMSQEVHESLDSIFVRLQEYSRDTLAKLDTKIRMLNHLLGEAERREKTLRELLAQLPAEKTEQAPGRVAQAPERVAQAFQPVPTGAEAPSPVSPPSPPSAAPVDRRRERVYALADEGRTLREITLATGLQIGEVELILNLRRVPSA